MPSQPFTRRVYLQPQDDPVVPIRYSKGAGRRARQLQVFLKRLHEGARSRLSLGADIELVVMNRRDWGRLFSYPYGFPFTRTRPGGGGVSLVVAADYPNRLLRRWDDILVRAGRAGEPMPGDLRELLDLLTGHEWGHAAANLSGLRSRVKWLDELMATYLFLAALHGAGLVSVAERFVAWARVQTVGSAIRRMDLGSFEYPRGKLKFDEMLWFQGVLTLRAAELFEMRGWGFAQAMREHLETADRGEVARIVLEVEPSFRDWFAVFGVQKDDEV